MKFLFIPFLASLLTINMCLSMAQWESLIDVHFNKSVNCVKRHPVLTVLFATVITYSLYKIFKSAQQDHIDDTVNRSVEFKAPYYDFQKRLYQVLLAMHIEENNLNTLGSYFDNLQQFKIELNLKPFGTNSVLQGVEKRLNDLINSMNDYLSLSPHKDTKTVYDEMLLKYALLLSFLSDSNEKMVKKIQF